MKKVIIFFKSGQESRVPAEPFAKTNKYYKKDPSNKNFIIINSIGATIDARVNVNQINIIYVEDIKENKDENKN